MLTFSKKFSIFFVNNGNLGHYWTNYIDYFPHAHKMSVSVLDQLLLFVCIPKIAALVKFLMQRASKANFSEYYINYTEISGETIFKNILQNIFETIRQR